MSRRSEITAERFRLAKHARSIINHVRPLRRDLSDGEQAEVEECVSVVKQIDAELKAMGPEVVPLVKLDARLTEDRTSPVSVKICWEMIDELEREAKICPDVNRAAGIKVEIETWREELSQAMACDNAIKRESVERNSRPLQFT